MGTDVIDWDAVWQGDTSGVSEYFHEALEVATFPGRGRGVRTVAPLRAGELLLAERAVATAPESKLADVLVRLQETLEEPWRSRLANLCDDEEPLALDKPLDLWSWPGEQAIVDPITAVAVPLARMHRKVALNAYRCCAPVSEYAFTPDKEVHPSNAKRHETYGVFLLGSLVNHSCVPNVSKVLLAEWVFLRAARDLAPGDELTQFYCDVRMPRKVRQQELRQLYGFSCDCPRCVFEEQLERNSGKLLEPLLGLYSCQVPRSFHSRNNGSLRPSQLEGLVDQAEQAALTSFRALENSDRNLSGSPESAKLWLTWPLVPALSQLAARLRLDGRRAESTARWLSAEAAAGSVIPFSNVHLRILAELLLTQAEEEDADGIEEALRASLHATAAAYGGGALVWQKLFGFRMPHSVLAALEHLGHGLAPEMHLCQIEFAWGSIELDASGRRATMVTLQCPAFERSEDVHLYASAESLSIEAPGAEKLPIMCPFEIDLARVHTRMSRRKRRLVVSVVEWAA